jgi:hypothetical protein
VIEIVKVMGFVLLVTVLGAGVGECSMLDKSGWGKEAGAPAKNAAPASIFYTTTADLPL